WQRLIDHIRNHPAGAVASALDSPLTLSLIRDAFRGVDGSDVLLDQTRFATREDVEDYLIAWVVPAAYADRPGRPTERYSLEEAQCWLGYVAARMNRQHTRDLVWWRVHQWAPAAPRIVTAMLIGAAAGGIVLELAHILGRHVGVPFPLNGLGGMVIGILGGLAAGLTSERREPHVQRRSRFLWS